MAGNFTLWTKLELIILITLLRTYSRPSTSSITATIQRSFTCLLICAHTLAKLCDHTSRLQDQMTTGLELLSCIPRLQFLILLAQHPATATDSMAQRLTVGCWTDTTWM